MEKVEQEIVSVLWWCHPTRELYYCQWYLSLGILSQSVCLSLSLSLCIYYSGKTQEWASIGKDGTGGGLLALFFENGTLSIHSCASQCCMLSPACMMPEDSGSQSIFLEPQIQGRCGPHPPTSGVESIICPFLPYHSNFGSNLCRHVFQDVFLKTLSYF